MEAWSKEEAKHTWQGSSNAFESLPLTLIEKLFLSVWCFKVVTLLASRFTLLAPRFTLHAPRVSFWILGMVVVEWFADDGCARVVHPDESDGWEFEESLDDLCLVVAVVAVA